jgi:hypothetical protein
MPIPLSPHVNNPGQAVIVSDVRPDVKTNRAGTGKLPVHVRHFAFTRRPVSVYDAPVRLMVILMLIVDGYRGIGHGEA